MNLGEIRLIDLRKWFMRIVTEKFYPRDATG